MNRSQDGVVEFSVDRLYDEFRARAEAETWAAAADDPEFRGEAARLEAEFGDRWPDIPAVLDGAA